MPKIHGKYARFYLDHHDIYLKSYEATQNLETKVVDATNYADDFEKAEVLQATGTFELTARLENAYRGSGDVDAIYSPIVTVNGAHTAIATEIAYSSTGDPVSAGDIILVGGSEKMRVLDVDETNNILHVQRGYSDTTPIAHVSPAAAVTITSSSVANPTVITTATAHGLVTGDTVVIAGHSGSTPDINGSHVVTVLTTTTFTIPVNVTVGGTGGTSTKAVGITSSSVASPTVITTDEVHGLVTGDVIVIAGHTGSTPDINGIWTITVLTTTTFSIPIAVTVGGTGGTSAERIQIILSGDKLLDKLLYEETMAPAGVISNERIPMSLILHETPAVGDLAQMFRGLPGLSFSNPVADLASMRCSVKETGAIHMGTILAFGEYTITQGTPQYGQTVGLELGKVWKNARFVYHLYSFEVVTPTPTLAIVVERDDASDMPSKADYATLETGLDDVKGEWNEYTTPTTDDFWRIRFDVTGASAVCTIGIVVIGYVE